MLTDPRTRPKLELGFCWSTPTVIISTALRLEFKPVNNAVEYEALQAGLRLALEMKARKLQIYNYLQLVVEVVNENIKHTLKKKLKSAKGRWAEELPETLWSYRTTLFAMAYVAEAMIPVEVGISSPRHLLFDEVTNKDLHRANLDLQDERHADSKLQLAVYQIKIARYYNSKVKDRNFHISDFVLKKVFQANRKVGAETLGPTWEGPYKIIEEIQPRTYRLEDSEGRKTRHP
ncbi:Ribonuclease H-like domain containing protein [Abeliophyllum distichum]|uniref:Ribonuclease H-like domain containing protein n=1 Tax=Abeliophyllum distichum TaxID=126358 RepID=A0ABD1V5G0_9LAMI